MLRGRTLFVCDECSNHFSGLDIEYQATVLSAPVRCPKCQSWHTMPFLSQITQKHIYREIWKDIDMQQMEMSTKETPSENSTNKNTKSEE